MAKITRVSLAQLTFCRPLGLKIDKLRQAKDEMAWSLNSWLSWGESDVGLYIDARC